MNTKKSGRVFCITFMLLFGGGFLLCLFMPKAEYLYSERRMPAPAPELSADAVKSGRFMEDFDDFAVDAFPFRENFRKIKSYTAGKIFGRRDNNGIYAADGYISAMEYPMNEDSLEHAADRFRYVCEKYLTDKNKIYLSVIPDKNCFLAEESGHLSMDYAEFEQQMAAKLDFAEYIPVSDLLELDDYYKTDPHWRQEKIMDVAKRLAQAMGTELSQDYKSYTLKQDFYGAYYGQAALPLAPDSIQYMTTEATDSCTVYDGQNQKEIPVYDLEKAVGRDPYEMFLSGSLSLITINNPAAAGKKLVIFRDSFGSSIAPLLISGYSQITLVDIRYIHPDFLEKFIDFGDSDVLFLYSTLVLNNSDTIR